MIVVGEQNLAELYFLKLTSKIVHIYSILYSIIYYMPYRCICDKHLKSITLAISV